MVETKIFLPQPQQFSFRIRVRCDRRAWQSARSSIAGAQGFAHTPARDKSLCDPRVTLRAVRAFRPHASRRILVHFRHPSLRYGKRIVPRSVSDRACSLGRDAVNNLLLLSVLRAYYALAKGAGRLVLCRRNESQINTIKFALFRDLAEPPQDGVLDTTSEYPTAQQQGVDPEGVRSFLWNDESHDAIVAEAILNLDPRYCETIPRQ